MKVSPLSSADAFRTERPIIFSGDAVRAILAGRKTQTRRAVKHDEYYACLSGDCPHEEQAQCEAFMVTKCPYGVPGDRLWVRWAFWLYTPPSTNPRNIQVWDEHTRCVRWPSGEVIEDCVPDTTSPSWQRKPSIHMPRWASRLLLETTEVRVQRVQDISEEDAQAAGARIPTEIRPDSPHEAYLYRENYRFMWDSLNAKRGYGWETNPFVWAITFKVVK